MLDVPRDSGRAKTLYRAGVALQKNVPIVLEMTTSVSASWHFVINLLLRVSIPYIIGQFSHDPVRYPASLNLYQYF